jgi:DNA polymerase
MQRARLPQHIDSVFGRDGCKDCELSKLSYPVHPRGSWKSQVDIIGEAAGKKEEEEDLTFCGPAGRFFEEALTSIGLDIDKDFLLYNSTLCRPHAPLDSQKENRQPSVLEVKACSKNIITIAKTRNSALVVSAGVVPSRAVMKKFPGSISRIVGQFFSPDEHNLETEADLFVIWHPSYILRNQNMKNEWIKQLIVLRDYMIGRKLIDR